MLAGAALALAVLAAVGLIGFGSHTLGFLDALGEQQQLVATHSVPAETARLVGLSGTPAWWRHLYLAGFCVVLAFTMWRTLRGADWRVMAGWATLALLVSTAWLLPWYAIWLLPLAALGGDRRLCAATLLFCAYAILIHLPLADPLLSPAAHRTVEHVHITAPRRSSPPRTRRFQSPSRRPARSALVRPRAQPAQADRVQAPELEDLEHVHEVHAGAPPRPAPIARITSVQPVL